MPATAASRPHARPDRTSDAQPPRNALAESRERGIATRTALLEGALEVFATLDYDAASMRELARRLGVSHNIVHHHFGSKRALWEAALEHGFAGITRDRLAFYERLRSETAAESVAAIGAMVRDALGVYARYPALARIFARECAQPGRRLDYLYRRYTQRVVDVLQQLLARDPVDAARHDPRIVVLYVVGGTPALYTHGALARKLGLDPADPAVIGNYERTVAALLMHGLTPIPICR